MELARPSALKLHGDALLFFSFPANALPDALSSDAERAFSALHAPVDNRDHGRNLALCSGLGTKHCWPPRTSRCRCRATNSYNESRKNRGMSPASVARRQAPPRYRATRRAAADRVRSRSPEPACGGSYHTTESTIASPGCRARTARPKVLSSAANWRVPWRSCRRTSWTLSAQNPQVPSYSKTGLGDSTSRRTGPR